MSFYQAVIGAKEQLAECKGVQEYLSNLLSVCGIFATETLSLLQLANVGYANIRLYQQLQKADDHLNVQLIKEIPYGDKDRNVLDIYVPVGVSKQGKSTKDKHAFEMHKGEESQGGLHTNLIQFFEGLMGNKSQGVPQQESIRNPLKSQTELTSDPAPVVLFIHGGVWTIGERWQFAQFATRLAQEGIICVVATYSTYPDALASEMVLETSSVLTWVQQNIHLYGGDLSRIHMVGHSAGAQLCSMALILRAYLMQVAEENDHSTADSVSELNIQTLYENVVQQMQSCEQNSKKQDAVPATESIKMNLQASSQTRLNKLEKSLQCPQNSQLSSIISRIQDERKDIYKSALEFKMPYSFVGMAGVYDIGMQYQYESWRGVQFLSTLRRAVGDVQNFLCMSSARFMEHALAQELNKKHIPFDSDQYQAHGFNSSITTSADQHDEFFPHIATSQYTNENSVKSPINSKNLKINVPRPPASVSDSSQCDQGSSPGFSNRSHKDDSATVQRNLRTAAYQNQKSAGQISTVDSAQEMDMLEQCYRLSGVQQEDSARSSESGQQVASAERPRLNRSKSTPSMSYQYQSHQLNSSAQSFSINEQGVCSIAQQPQNTDESGNGYFENLQDFIRASLEARARQLQAALFDFRPWQQQQQTTSQGQSGNCNGTNDWGSYYADNIAMRMAQSLIAGMTHFMPSFDAAKRFVGLGGVNATRHCDKSWWNEDQSRVETLVSTQAAVMRQCGMIMGYMVNSLVAMNKVVQQHYENDMKRSKDQSQYYKSNLGQGPLLGDQLAMYAGGVVPNENSSGNNPQHGQPNGFDNMTSQHGSNQFANQSQKGDKSTLSRGASQRGWKLPLKFLDNNNYKNNDNQENSQDQNQNDSDAAFMKLFHYMYDDFSLSAARKMPYTIIMSSCQDSTLPWYGSSYMYNLLKRVGVQCRNLLYNHTEHCDFVVDYSLRPNQSNTNPLNALQAAATWFDRRNTDQDLTQSCPTSPRGKHQNPSSGRLEAEPFDGVCHPGRDLIQLVLQSRTQPQQPLRTSVSIDRAMDQLPTVYTNQAPPPSRLTRSWSHGASMEQLLQQKTTESMDDGGLGLDSVPVMSHADIIGGRARACVCEGRVGAYDEGMVHGQRVGIGILMPPMQRTGSWRDMQKCGMQFGPSGNVGRYSGNSTPQGQRLNGRRMSISGSVRSGYFKPL